MSPETSEFSTTDTALAAYLYSRGFYLLKLQRLDDSRGRTAFIFRNDDYDLIYHVKEWEDRRAVGNIHDWFGAYRSLVKRAKNA